MDILEATQVIARTNDQAIIQKAKEVAYAFDLQCLKEAADEFEDLDILTADSIVHHLLYVNSDALMFPKESYYDDLEEYVVCLKMR